MKENWKSDYDLRSGVNLWDEKGRSKGVIGDEIGIIVYVPISDVSKCRHFLKNMPNDNDVQSFVGPLEGCGSSEGYATSLLLRVDSLPNCVVC